MATAFTTLLLIFLPYFFPSTSTLGEQALLADNPIYMWRVWTALIHPLLVLVAIWGVAVKRMPYAPGRASVGLLFVSLWSFTEAIQQGLTLVSLNWIWRPAYLGATSAFERDQLASAMTTFHGISEGLFFLLVLAFTVGNLLLASAVWDRGPLDKIVSVGFVIAGALGPQSLLTRFGAGVVPPQAMAIAYPLFQPTARFLTGLWLWPKAETDSTYPQRTAA